MFKKYQFVEQESSKDCGIACLLMIIKRYGGNISFEKLRSLSNTNQNGTTAYNLIETAKKLGFDANGYKCDDLKYISKLPCIAHIVKDNKYFHYIVINKIDYIHKEIIVSDPAIGTKKYHFKDFEDI
jgi:ABC-type bacteriocin/lantibiotic exporter with double-glycine peptidase domain